jgi:transcription elongation factor GreA-like protein
MGRVPGAEIIMGRLEEIRKALAEGSKELKECDKRIKELNNARSLLADLKPGSDNFIKWTAVAEQLENWTPKEKGKTTGYKDKIESAFGKNKAKGSIAYQKVITLYADSESFDPILESIKKIPGIRLNEGKDHFAPSVLDKNADWADSVIQDGSKLTLNRDMTEK